MSVAPYLNFRVDHMTLLLQPKFYNVAYVLFRTVFGVGPKDLIYEKRKEWDAGKGDVSMTYAVRLGKGLGNAPTNGDAVHDATLGQTIVAVVQPSEPVSMPSHVREMLDKHRAAAHWQHIALQTSDLLGFYEHASRLGVQFITPILRDEADDLIQVFSGEWFFPGSEPSGLFFEFLQRNPSQALLQQIEMHREAWFRDKTFLGLYGEKEREYQSGSVTPFISFATFDQLYDKVGRKQVWEIDEADLQFCRSVLMDSAKR